MALFSFRHSVKTFSPKCESADRVAREGQTASHLRYITREAAARVVLRERLDHLDDTEQARSAERAAMKRRGRVCERFIIALPVEASETQREDLARRFANELSQGKAGFVLAIHDKAGNDIRNPHFHLVAFDHHERSGGRGRPRSVLGMARKNAVEQKAKLWADIHNEMMRTWGFRQDSMISHLSFSERGVDQIPQIHEGPAARNIAARGSAVQSKPEWRHVDAGHSRADANQVIKEINQLKRKASHDIRLGSGNEGSPVQGNSSSPPWRKDAGRGGRGIDGPSIAGQAPERYSQDDQGDRSPPWVAGSRVAGHSGAAGEQPRKSTTPPFCAPMERRSRAVRRRRSIRRVFLELIFLRDTLRARLATLGGRRHALPSSKIADAERSTSDRLGALLQHPYQSHANAAEIGER